MKGSTGSSRQRQAWRSLRCESLERRIVLTAFTDIVDSLGPFVPGKYAGATWFDYNNDGQQDLFVNGSEGSSNALFQNDGNGQLTDVAAEAGIDRVSGHAGVVSGDIDNDGFVDLLLTGRTADIFERTSPKVRVLRNNGDGTFKDRTGNVGIVPPETVGSAALADIDGDSFLDLFITGTGALTTKVQHASKLYRNNGDFTFTDITSESDVNARLGACSAGFSDYDDDGDVDLFVSNCNDVHIGRTPIQLFRNEGNFKFTDVTHASKLGQYTGWWFGHSFGDFDNDGDVDLFSTGVGSSTMTGRHALFQNNGDGTFTNIGPQVGINWEFAWGSTSADLDNDGYADLLFAGTLDAAGFYYDNPGRLLLNQLGAEPPSEKFRDISSELEIDLRRTYVSGVASADFDGDGLSDILVLSQSRTGENASVLLRNEMNTENHWIGVELVGTLSNRDAVGARVTVQAGDLTQVKEIYAGSSFLSSDSQSLRFGLGARNDNPLIRVRWPSGVDEFFANTGGVDRIIEAVEGHGVQPIAGDANLDGKFDQLDIVHVLQASKYLTGEPANFTEGDYTGDGAFDQLDVVAALQTGAYLKQVERPHKNWGDVTILADVTAATVDDVGLFVPWTMTASGVATQFGPFVAVGEGKLYMDANGIPIRLFGSGCSTRTSGEKICWDAEETGTSQHVAITFTEGTGRFEDVAGGFSFDYSPNPGDPAGVISYSYVGTGTVSF